MMNMNDVAKIKSWLEVSVKTEIVLSEKEWDRILAPMFDYFENMNKEMDRLSAADHDPAFIVKKEFENSPSAPGNWEPIDQVFLKQQNERLLQENSELIERLKAAELSRDSYKKKYLTLLKVKIAEIQPLKPNVPYKLPYIPTHPYIKPAGPFKWGETWNNTEPIILIKSVFEELFDQKEPKKKDGDQSES
jgi:hypothetical protein